MDKEYLYHTHVRESRIFKRRAFVTAIVFFVISLLLTGRLFYLQIDQHKAFSTLSKKNVLAIIPLPPRRGLIFDRNDIPIATNLPSYTLNVTPSQNKNTKKLLNDLSKIIPISNEEKALFWKRARQHHRYEAVPLKLHLSEKQLAQFYVNRYKLPGVTISVNLMRNYPFNQYLSPVLGYVGRINNSDLSSNDKENYAATNYIGKVGIEKYYETMLHGKVGHAIAEINASGHIIRYVSKTPPISGRDLHLSIDSNLQQFIYDAMQGNTGAAVAIDPRNGQVLALVSVPSYNPNGFVTGISSREYHRLIHSKQKPLYNRSIRGLFSPGSTIKPFYALFALADNIISAKSMIFDPGWFKLPHTKHIYHDWKHSGHGWVNVTKAITVSCDTFFYNLAVAMGITAIDNTLHQFGFGESTGIDLGEELTGTVPSPQWKRAHQNYPWYTGDTIITGIGQGSLLVTPLQLAKATATIAERGVSHTPHLMLFSQSGQSIVPYKPPAKSKSIVIKKSIWDIVIHAMEDVIYAPKGTAVNFGKKTGYIAAAKTGTAQVFGKTRDEEYSRTNIPLRLRNNHLFIVFAPANHPTIALAIVIEHAGEADGIARKVLDHYLKHRVSHNN